VSAAHSVVDIADHVADAFAQAASAPDPRDPGVFIRRESEHARAPMTLPPQAPPAPRTAHETAKTHDTRKTRDAHKAHESKTHDAHKAHESKTHDAHKPHESKTHDAHKPHDVSAEAAAPRTPPAVIRRDRDREPRATSGGAPAPKKPPTVIRRDRSHATSSHDAASPRKTPERPTNGARGAASRERKRAGDRPLKRGSR
jgi:hypothetical protein